MRRETLNTRGAIKDLKVSVRLVNETPMEGTDVKGFWESLGFQHERESAKTGQHYTIHTLGALPVHVSTTVHLNRDKPGKPIICKLCHDTV